MLLILQLLEQRELFVRLGAVQLLIAVNRHRSRELQDAFLFNPTGMMQLMDMLGDSEEILRNEVMILLIDVASSNAEIQKIASFNGAFERLYEIMKDEGNTGFIVRDCLQLMVNLLRGNMFTQRYFRETSSIERLLAVFPDQDTAALKTSPAIAALVVEVVEELGCGVPSDGQNAVHVKANKEILGKTLLLAVAQVATVPLGAKVSSEGRCAALQALCVLVDAHEANASRLWRVILPEGDHGPPRPATSQLLIDLLQHNGTAAEKKALRRVFDTFLRGSSQIQLDMAKTYSPEVQERTGLDEVSIIHEGAAGLAPPFDTARLSVCRA